MKLYWVTVPAGLALACVGMLLARVASYPHYSSSPDIPGTVRHLVTEQMIVETDAEKNKQEPKIEAKDTRGEPIVLGSRKASRPQYVYFVMDGCPCSYDAEPLFHDLYKQFKGQVDFVSVTNATPEKAKQWAADLQVPYPVIADPNQSIIHAYGARASVYSALLTKDGHIAKMWPGYSADYLKDINSTIARLAGIPIKPFDTKYAPQVKATGCSFTNPNFK